MNPLGTADTFQNQLVKDKELIESYDSIAKIFVDKQNAKLVFWKGFIRSDIEYRIYYLENYPSPTDVLIVFPALQRKIEAISFEQAVLYLNEIQFQEQSPIRKEYSIPWWVSDKGMKRLNREKKEMGSLNFEYSLKENVVVFTALQNIQNPKLAWRGKLIIELSDNYPEDLPIFSIEKEDHQLYDPKEYLKSIPMEPGTSLKQLTQLVNWHLSKISDFPTIPEPNAASQKVIDFTQISDQVNMQCGQCNSPIPESEEIKKCKSCNIVFHSTCYDYLKKNHKRCPKCGKSL
jgi:hypothetical protein